MNEGERNNPPERNVFWTEWVKGKSPEEIGKMLALKEYQSEHDTLTGLPNRRGWEAALNTFIPHAEVNKEPISFLYIDIDKFKAINDEWGHEAGDQVLIFVSGVLKDLLKEPHITARIGGDEFAVLLMDTDSQKATQIRDSIKEELNRSLNEKDEGDLLAAVNLKLSIGVTTRVAGQKPTEALNKADADMYNIKRESKNG